MTHRSSEAGCRFHTAKQSPEEETRTATLLTLSFMTTQRHSLKVSLGFREACTVRCPRQILLIGWHLRLKTCLPALRSARTSFRALMGSCSALSHQQRPFHPESLGQWATGELCKTEASPAFCRKEVAFLRATCPEKACLRISLGT